MSDGYPAPSFQWRKNGTAINGATTSSLALTNVTTSDAATYSVVATNDAGSAVSPDEVLVVTATATNVAPAITSQPGSQSVVEGGSATFTVAASGTPSPTYQWQKNGVTMAGATNATLTLASLTTSDAATYTAVATNVAGTATSNGAVLTVTSSTVTNPPSSTAVAPAITTQPASQSITAGGAVTFTVAASGTPAPTFQWTKNSVAISGATNTTLSITALTSADAGSYAAIATNTAGSATSATAVLTVTDPIVTNPPPPSSSGSAPTITTQPPASQTVLAGTSATVSAAASGSPSPSYQWRKNGSNISGATSSTLTLKAITSADAATYTVMATNSSGTVVSNNSVVVVQMAPVFTTQPVSQAIAVGATAKFTVAVSAIPGATLQWQKDGVPLAGATSSTLILSSITSNDVASYNVVATNAVGSATSKTATLVLAAPPIITSQPVNQTANSKSNVTFTVAASGSPTPTYQWKKNGTSIPGATSATLTLKSVNKVDAGTYSVDASNIVGWVSSNRVSLTVNTGSSKGSADDDAGPADTVPVVDGVPTSSRLANLSVRATAGSGSSGLIVGFVINGTTSKPVLIRGIGPALRDFGVTGVLSDPKVSLYSGAVMTATNDDWMNSDNALLIANTSVRVGAFSLPDQAADSALLATLDSGAYTAQLTGKDATNGIALVEVYDTATGTAATASKLINLSVRAQISSGAGAPNVGFVITGTGPKRVMIRAVGPTLAGFGVTDAIADPQVELFQGDVRVNQNDNWGGSSSLSAVFSQVGAFGFSDPSSRDAVLLATLDPGAYTVVVSGVNGSTGVGLVELYEIP